MINVLFFRFVASVHFLIEYHVSSAKQYKYVNSG